MSVNGVISEQTKIYQFGKDVREESLAKAANKMVDMIGQEGNFTYITPIQATIQEADLVDIF